MNCNTCKLWQRATLRRFSSQELRDESGGPGEGLCRSPGPLEARLTPKGFGCVYFKEYASPDDQIEVKVFDGESWQFWDMIVCPDCDPALPGHGLGGGTCFRCTGTNKVRKYADGFVGDERTREHPKEVQLRIAHQRAEALARAQAEVARLQAEIEGATPAIEEIPPPPSPEGTPLGAVVARRGKTL